MSFIGFSSKSKEWKITVVNNFIMKHCKFDCKSHNSDFRFVTSQQIIDLNRISWLYRLPSGFWYSSDKPGGTTMWSSKTFLNYTLLSQIFEKKRFKNIPQVAANWQIVLKHLHCDLTFWVNIRPIPIHIWTSLRKDLICCNNEMASR